MTTPTTPGVIEPNFNGLRVVAFESRMAAETGLLIERFGGRPRIAPAMREVPLSDNQRALEFASHLLAHGFDVVIFLTGVGFRELFRVMETRYSRDDLRSALAQLTTVARGPKPTAAMRELGLEPALTIPEPNTSREVLASLSARMDLRGKRVAVQEYGASNRDLCAGLEARGAEVTVVPVYRWGLPLDRGPLADAVRAIAANDADIALFTSSNQVNNVLQVAEADGLGSAFRRGLETLVVASIGPVCSGELRHHGITVDLEPTHARLGHLVKEAALRGTAMLARKRPVGPDEPGHDRVMSDDPEVDDPEVIVTRPAAFAAVRTGAANTPIAAPAAGLYNHPFLKACRREATPFTPIWLMRQAGRYLPEYRRVRERHAFLEMCQQPELAAEVTVTAVERLGVDAAIIFADILLPLIPMGVGLHYEASDGPVIDRPLRSEADLDQVPPIEPTATLGFVADAIRLVRRALGEKTPLIGFAGAPFTLASYLIEGGSSRQYQATKTLMYTQPATWRRLMTLIARMTADYLNMQVAAGADAVQLFDSWVGNLGPDDYRRFVLPYTRGVIAAIRPGVPVIHFGTVTGNLLELMRAAGGTVIGLDWRVDLGEAWARLGDEVAVQGNLDPIALFAGPAEIRRRAKAILDRAGGRPGHIFNLGHGLLPDTPVDHVIALVEAVHELSSRRR